MKIVVITLEIIIVTVSLLANEIPTQISFQGILKDSSGAIVADSVYSVTFTIYDDSSGGSIWWQEEQAIDTEDGYFTALLGSVNPIQDSTFDGAERYLAIQIDGALEMQKRLTITSSAYAYRSADSNCVDDDWVIDGDDICHMDGNVGIGVSNPEAQLHVSTKLRVGSWTTNPMIQLLSPEGYVNGFELWSASRDLCIGYNSTGIRFRIDTMDRMTIDSVGRVGIGVSNPQGALDVKSTTGAFIVPRMTTAQRNALTAVNGMIIYNTSTNQFNFYENGAWVIK